MWLMTTVGFFSVVEEQPTRKTPRLMIRARAREDLMALRGRYLKTVPIIATPKADYPFRIFLSKAAFAGVLVRIVKDIAYSNFKSAVGKLDSEREAVYHRVWADLLAIQRREDLKLGIPSNSCECGHAVEEHGGDHEHPASTACTECGCVAYDPNTGTGFL